MQFRTEFFNFFNHPNFLATLGAGFDRVNAGAAFGRLTQARLRKTMFHPRSARPKCMDGRCSWSR